MWHRFSSLKLNAALLAPSKKLLDPQLPFNHQPTKRLGILFCVMVLFDSTFQHFHTTCRFGAHFVFEINCRDEMRKSHVYVAPSATTTNHPRPLPELLRPRRMEYVHWIVCVCVFFVVVLLNISWPKTRLRQIVEPAHTPEKYNITIDHPHKHLTRTMPSPFWRFPAPETPSTNDVSPPSPFGVLNLP